MTNTFLPSVIKQFEYYKSLGDKTISQLSFDELQWQSDKESNSIAIIVKHIVGNMHSRWTNFLTDDGEKEWRDRDQEFRDTFISKEDVIAAWESGWICLFEPIKSLQIENLEHIIYIRNQGHSVTEAINRQLAHYPYHIGQIVFYAKQLNNSEWDSLSIKKNKSRSYNDEKFSQDKKT